MLVTLPNKNPFFSSPMPKNPKYIRERLFQGIDKDYNVTDMGIVVEVLGELENFHMSREELEDTRLGKHINELRRKASDNKELATRAKSLIKRWRDLLAPESGPPPGGGNNNNNNSNLVTNGNSRHTNSHTYPGPGSRGPSHPAARGNNSVSSPRVPPANTKLSPSANSSQKPTAAPSSASSQSARSNVRNNGPNVQSPAVSKALPGSGSRDSPVVISSGSSSPVSIQSVQEISRPCSPATSSVSIIQSRESSPVRLSQKRPRARDDSEVAPAAKFPRLNGGGGGGGASGASSPTSLKSGAVSSPRKNKNARRARQPLANSGPDLKRQMLQARTGKVKTTQELIANLGLESKVQTSPPDCPVSDLVPKEDKSELMDRFFSSQQKSESEEGSEPDLASRPSTAADEASSSEESSSEPSRYPTPAPRQSVEDILSQLPPIDSEKVLADLEQNLAEEEPEMEGLIPAFKPRTEVTSDLVENLNNGQLDHIGGIRDYQGDFKEWHQMASLPSKDGELLHILPYSLID